MKEKLLFVAGLLAAFAGAAYGQKDDRVFGPEYKVPAVRVHLTDEETGGPFANKEMFAKYCWGWDVLTKTVETDRMPSTECTENKIRSDAEGVAVLPAMTIRPSRPTVPAGAEYSAPKFKFAGIVVRDDKHNTYLSVFDAEVNLLDNNGEVRRTVYLLKQ